ncbi:hypothetical protein [Corallibacter sp.]|uniref:hypothetical protein n=1 Tax=Corallibacter sp. TaxID=2038084 RepID=UPI003A8CC7AA
MDLSKDLNTIQNRLKELIEKLDNNKEDLDILESEFIELSEFITKIEDKMDKDNPTPKD